MTYASVQAEAHMTIPLPIFWVEKINYDRVAADGGESEWRDKLASRGCHDDFNFRTATDELSDEHWSLVGGDSARDANEYMFAF